MIDFGAELNGCCSDLSRTFIVGSPTQRQLDLYDLVLEAHKVGLALVKKGTTLRKIHEKVEVIFKKKRLNNYFTHGIGHGILDKVHTDPKWNEPLKVGDFITIEPGLYIKGRGSIRIEDVVAITEKGVEILSNFPRELIQI